MLTLIKKIVLPVLVFGTLSVFGQAKLGIQNVYFPDTVKIGATYDFSVTIKNKGNQSFFGDIKIDFQTDTMFGLQIVGNIDSLQNNIILSNQPLFPGDTVVIKPQQLLILKDNFKSNFTNIVVIWPRAIGALTADSATITTFVQEPSSILNSVDKTPSFISYPNPFSDKITLYTKVKNKSIENTRIFDCAGRICFEGKPTANTIDTRGLSKGIYIIEITNNDNQVSRGKIMKE